MGGFTSLDDFINQATTNGKFWRTDWNKLTFGTTAHTAGMWYLLSQTGGNPAASSILGTGTNLAFQALTDATATAAGPARYAGRPPRATANDPWPPNRNSVCW